MIDMLGAISLTVVLIVASYIALISLCVLFGRGWLIMTRKLILIRKECRWWEARADRLERLLDGGPDLTAKVIRLADYRAAKIIRERHPTTSGDAA